jgi:hypothetical protein
LDPKANIISYLLIPLIVEKFSHYDRNIRNNFPYIGGNHELGNLLDILGNNSQIVEECRFAHGDRTSSKN